MLHCMRATPFHFLANILFRTYWVTHGIEKLNVLCVMFNVQFYFIVK